MTDLKSEEGFVRYYCTAGKGMERFLMEEVTKKLAAEDVCQMPGKVLFSSSEGIDRVIGLKAAERLFLLLKQDSPVCLPAHTCPAKATSLLQSRLLGDWSQWTRAVMTWSRLQAELVDRRTTSKAASTALEVKTKKKERRGSEEEEKCDVDLKNRGGQKEEGWNGRQRSGKQNVVQKRKREEEEEEEGEGKKTVAQISSSEENVERREGEKDLSVQSSIRGIEDAAGESLQNVRTSVGGDTALQQPDTIEAEPPSVTTSFRINCKCTGSVSRYFSSQEVSKVIGVGLNRLLGWRTDLRNPQLEVNVYLSDDHCLLGIPLTRLPLANRPYMKTTGLRSTVAWAMATLAQIQPGCCVIDPMCGVGTILIEAAQEHKAACFLGMDIDDGQLKRANENIESAELGNRIHLLKASSLVLPLPSASVDAVVCDLPFGRKFGTKANMAANLPLILAEMERVLCVGGALVLLLSPQLSCQLKKLLAQNDTGRTSSRETQLQTGTRDCTSPSLSSTQRQPLRIQQGIDSPPPQKTDRQSELQHRLSLSSLEHQATLRVSLGLIDGLIHKYVKRDTLDTV